MGGEGQITQQAAGNNNVMKMVKSPSSKALVVRINLVFLACFLVVYATLILRPSSSVSYHENSAALVRCSLRECHHKVR
ncbi:hypothetical protein CRG98_009896 [Punica granatum]|uniref:Hexosyltransferase n=1 Tax=Punica granatum TaxID=22663 RepID=A0A2I0KN31_PUNGR|nr:hypothetical protein CRG98_009896 [Punica granatum]